MKRPAKVLILGYKGYQRSDEDLKIDCFSWPEVTKIENVSDYDAIIIGLVSLTNVADVNWLTFIQKFTVSSTYDVVARKGRIIFIGDPRFKIDLEGQTIEFLGWTGLEFEWHHGAGETVNYDETIKWLEPYVSYLNNIRRWEYSLINIEVAQRTREVLGWVIGKAPEQFSSAFELEPMCTNRVGRAVAFRVQVRAYRYRRQLGGKEVYEEYGRGSLIFLPDLKIAKDEMLLMVLADILGIQIQAPEPVWAEHIIAPGQESADNVINQKQAEISRLSAELNEATALRIRKRKCIKLLYSQGMELEECVRDILSEIGAQVEAPENPGKEDGWITINVKGRVYEGVLEIQGTRNDQFPESKLRQLMEWKNLGTIKRKKNYKGIFLGNSAREKPPTERPFPFSAGWKATAELNDISAIQTRDLYLFYLLSFRQELDRDSFWTALFESKGVVDTETLLEAHRAGLSDAFG